MGIELHPKFLSLTETRCYQPLVYGVRSITVRMELLRTSKSAPKKPYVPDAGCAAIERQKPIMERESITLVNPDGFPHLASEWRVLR
jgi:hypothetical protein